MRNKSLKKSPSFFVDDIYLFNFRVIFCVQFSESRVQ